MWRERECWTPKKMIMRVFKPALLLLVMAGILAVGSTRLELSDGLVAPTSTVEQMQRLAGLPLAFVENQGQWEMPARFVARTRGMVAYLEKDAMTLQLEARAAEERVKGVAVRLAFEGASEFAALAGEHLQAGVHNFFVGNNRSKWRREVPGYASVVYRGLYDGVDLCVREESGALEYDVLLAEGADLDQVVIRCDGIEGLEVNLDGSLAMETELGPITQHPPKTWYELASGERQPVECRFRKIDNHRYGFEVPERDMSLALVIDPWLEWSTYLGSPGDDSVFGLAVDASGAVIVAGYTDSMDFPTTLGAYQRSITGSWKDWYVACLGANGDTLLWSTYLGGSLRDWLYGMGLDDAGRVFVAGLTVSSDFPTTPGAYDETHNGGYDGAVACLNGNGTQLIYSTYLGGTIGDWILGLAVDGVGKAFVGGYTASATFPTTPGAFDPTYNGSREAFVSCLSSDGTVLVYSTFLGGIGEEGVADFSYPENMNYMGLALHAGEVTVGGLTRSLDFPTTPGAYDETYNGVNDAFVTRLNATGSDLVYSTFLGGSNGECVQSVAVDGFGVATVGGYTWSLDFPITPGAFNVTHNSYPDRNDAFVSRLDETGSALLYSTFIGGVGHDNTIVLVMDPDGSGTVLGGGITRSLDFPTTTAAYDTTYNNNADAMLFRLSPSGLGSDDLLYSTFIGGPGIDGAESIVLDPAPAYPSVLLGGFCQHDFPVTPGAYDTTYGNAAGADSVDGFICRFSYFVAGVEEGATVDRLPLVKLSSVYPNPTNGELGYEIDLQQPTNVQVDVFDITGRKVQTLLDERLPAGVHGYSERLRAEEGGLASGVYYLRVEANGVQESRRFTLVR